MIIYNVMIYSWSKFESMIYVLYVKCSKQKSCYMNVLYWNLKIFFNHISFHLSIRMFITIYHRDGSTRGVWGGAAPPWLGSTPPKWILGGWKIYVYERFFFYFIATKFQMLTKLELKTFESPQNKNKDKIIMYWIFYN